MEIKDAYYIIAMIGIAISGILWVNNQNSDRKSDTRSVSEDLFNHKKNHEKLEARVTTHEDKIDDKLFELDKKIEEKHTILNGKLDDLKDLIIERTK